MMRIAHVVTLVSPDGAYGGPVRVAVNQLKQLQARGHEVRLFAAARGYDELPTEVDGVPLSAFPAVRVLPKTGFAGLSSPALLAELRRVLPSYDIVQVHLARDLITLPAARLALSMRCPLFLQTHGMIDPSSNPLAKPLDLALTRDVLHRAATVFYLTEQEHRDLLAVSGGEIHLQHLVNGVPQAPEELRSVPAEREVLFLARLQQRKRPAVFVEAAQRLLGEFPDWRFTLVGPDEGEGPALRAAIAASGSGRITLEGALDPSETLARMARCAIYTLPSVNEPFPMSVLEATSLGKPVVITGTCGLAPYVEHWGAGAVVDDSVDGLVAALRGLMASDEKRRTEGSAALRMAKEAFGMAAVAELQLRCYRGAMMAVEGDTRPRVLFLTNTSTPYRVPVWSALAEETQLTVGLLERKLATHEECPQERSDDWVSTVSSAELPYVEASLPTWRVSRGAAVVYGLRTPLPFRFGDFDLVIIGGWDSPAYSQAYVAARRQGVPVLGFYESTLDSSRISRGPVDAYRRRFLRSMDGVIVPGAAAERSVQDKGVARIYRGFNPVDVERFATANTGAARGDRPLRVLFVGVLAKRKNVESILEACADQPWELGIAGSGPSEAALKSQARELGVGDRVTWHGYVPYAELPDLMADYDCLVLASHAEVWGLVVNEALATGMHVVVSRNCGVADSVAGMPGVHLCDPTPDSIRAGLAEADADCTGRIVDPPILAHTPRAFADVIGGAIKDTLARRGRTGLGKAS